MYIHSSVVLLSLVPAIVAQSSLAQTGCPSNPTVTATVTQTTVSTVTATNAGSSTSYVFLPGSSPTPVKKKKRSPCKPSSRSSTTTSAGAVSVTSTSSGLFSLTLGDSVTTTSEVSTTTASEESTTASSVDSTTTASSTSLSTSTSEIQTTSCPPTSTVTATAIDSQTSVTTVTVATQPTRTVYPCANLVNFQGPAYGDAAGTIPRSAGNSLYALSTPQGASPEACCNTCYFGLENCIQAYWYSYQGCVVSTAADLSAASGKGISGSCPAGTFNGLSYGPDTRPAFRSTGNFAGPCGQAYTNF